MSKKFFAPPVLKKCTYRWYIEFYQTHPITGLYTRVRETHGLNRIKDLKTRESHAKTIIRLLKKELPQGYPWKDLKAGILEDHLITEAIDFALSIKLRSPRKNSHKGYKTISGLLKRWLKQNGLSTLYIQMFSKKHVHAFFDYLLVKKKSKGSKETIRNRTINTYVAFAKSLWSELLDREWVEYNPWKALKTLPDEEKLRRPLEEHERISVLEYAQKNHKWLWYAILMQYYLFIRPSELRRMHFEDIDISKGLVTVKKMDSKKYKKRVLTLPDQLIPIFSDPFFINHPTNYLIFGEGMRPHPNKPVSNNRFNKVHKRILLHLKENGIINNIEGITFYSWKDTGARDHSKHISLFRMVDQMGHSDPRQTMTYYSSFEVNEEVKKLPVNL